MTVSVKHGDTPLSDKKWGSSVSFGGQNSFSSNFILGLGSEDGQNNTIKEYLLHISNMISLSYIR